VRKALLCIALTAMIWTPLASAESESITIQTTASAARGLDCTVTRFRAMAKNIYRPWYQRAVGEWRLRKMKRCAANDRTRAGMRKWHIRIARQRGEAIANYRELTPYVGLGSRWSIPVDVVACESGGSWSAVNTSNPVVKGPYQMDERYWDYPWPVTSFRDKMAHHREAREVLYTQGAGAWECW
jgi:hypothetical protein